MTLTLRLWNSRGKGGVFSFFWPVVTPLFLLVIYYFAFGVILNLRQIPGQGNYALSMFCGMTVFNIFAESLNSGAGSVMTQPGYVKNAGFDLEVLPFSSVGCAVISGLIYGIIVLIAAGITGSLSVQVWQLPFALFPYVFFCMGIALFAGAVSVYLRDFPQFAVLLQQGLFFMTPIIYPLSVVPESCRWLIALNPLTGYTEAVRCSVFGGSFSGWGWLWVNGLVFYLLGWGFFHKTRKGFADVI